MKRFLSHGFMIMAGVLGVASASVQADQDVTKKAKSDRRETILRRFLQKNHCPDQEYAWQFVAEADNYGLDWRLLPSLSLVETGGGRTARGNNLFGWDNGKSTFNSIGEAIHHVAFALAHGRSYRGKDLRGKLLAYNTRTDYSAAVLSVMRQISPSPELEPAS